MLTVETTEYVSFSGEYYDIASDGLYYWHGTHTDNGTSCVTVGYKNLGQRNHPGNGTTTYLLRDEYLDEVSVQTWVCDLLAIPHQ